MRILALASLALASLALIACHKMDEMPDAGCVSDTDCPGLTSLCNKQTGACFENQLPDIRRPDLVMPPADLATGIVSCPDRPCLASQLCCNGTCIERTNEHCVTCGVRCDAGKTCCLGADQAYSCTDPMGVDKYNCGACGKACEAPRSCVKGRCG